MVGGKKQILSNSVNGILSIVLIKETGSSAWMNLFISRERWTLPLSRSHSPHQRWLRKSVLVC